MNPQTPRGRRVIRTWRSGCAATPPPAADPPGLQSALLRLVARVARLTFSVSDPEYYASKRSEIVSELRRLAKHRGAADAP
jgi:hypothetical protein